MKRHFTISTPVATDKIRFVVEYEGFGVIFSTEIDEVDETCAIAYFKKMYASARINSIKEKK
ncbi:hypothetical protein [Flavobacterium sp.]